MTQLDNHTRFFGNLCNADDKIEEIEYFHSELEVLIEQEKSKLEGVQVDFDNNPVQYNKKFHFEYTLEQSLRTAVIIKLVTFLEVELQNYCCDLQTALNLQVKYNDFKGTVLEQFKTYANKIALLTIDFSSSKYEKVKQLIELRNCIVHYEGQIENFYGRKFNRSETLHTLARQMPSIKIKDNDFVFLEKDACRNCLSIIKEFVDMIYNSALDKFPKY